MRNPTLCRVEMYSCHGFQSQMMIFMVWWYTASSICLIFQWENIARNCFFDTLLLCHLRTQISSIRLPSGKNEKISLPKEDSFHSTVRTVRQKLKQNVSIHQHIWKRKRSICSNVLSVKARILLSVLQRHSKSSIIRNTLTRLMLRILHAIT